MVWRAHTYLSGREEIAGALAVVMDLFARRVIGWSLSSAADTALISSACGWPMRRVANPGCGEASIQALNINNFSLALQNKSKASVGGKLLE